VFVPGSEPGEIGFRQTQQGDGGLTAKFLNVHESTGQLDESFEEISGDTIAILEPEFLEDIVSLVEQLAIEAIEVTRVVRIESTALKISDTFRYGRRLFAHEMIVKKKIPAESPNPSKNPWVLRATFRDYELTLTAWPVP
jgi:hypothetical protein